MYEDAKVVVRAENLEVSLDFYTTRLGFEVSSQNEGHWAELEGPGIRILLFKRLAQQPDLGAGAKGVSIGLWVEDLEKAKAELESRGVLFEGEPVDLHLIRVAFLSDPSGHQLMLCQVRSDTPVSTDA